MIDRQHFALVNGIIATPTKKTTRNGVTVYTREVVISDEEGDAVTIVLQSRDSTGLFIEDRDKEG
jgi:hypothetical protein